MRIWEIFEDATSGSTSSSAIPTVPNPLKTRSSKKNSGIKKNALDGDNIFDSTIKRENMDHDKDSQCVPELKSALLAQKDAIKNADDDAVYDIIDKIMSRIAKSHGISGQTLHDMWVSKYKEIPDTWIMHH